MLARTVARSFASVRSCWMMSAAVPSSARSRARTRLAASTSRRVIVERLCAPPKVRPERDRP
eukprot:1647143-Prymnesium_polylepis.1